MRELTYGQPQIWLATVFVILVVVMVAAFVTVGLSSRRDIRFPAVKRVGYRIRTWWFYALCAILVAVLAVGFTRLPYGPGGGDGAVSEVAVTGGQFYWTIAPGEVPAGEVAITLTSADVNHGLGIYSPSGKMLGSVQAMPGYSNTLHVDLDEPGEYQLLCLEFCGVGHHRMHGTLTVTGAGGGSDGGAD